MNNKAFSLFSTKSFNTEDDKDFIVEGIASTPTLDSDNDSLNSLGASFRNMPFPFILNHDHSNPVGQVVEATPTNKGIAVKIRIPYVKELGKLKEQTDYAIHAIKYNIISGLSIGFSANKADAVVNQKGGLNINKFEVYELSLTPLQSNTTAFITAFKSLKQDQELDNTKDLNSNDETITTNDDTTKEVVLDTNTDDAIVKEDVLKNENNTALEVSKEDVVENQTSDIVEVKKSIAVKLIQDELKANTQKVKLI